MIALSPQIASVSSVTLNADPLTSKTRILTKTPCRTRFKGPAGCFRQTRPPCPIQPP